MSHVKEIKKKNELQAKFQLAINNTSNHVSNWLRPLNRTDEETVDNDFSKLEFLKLPIISGSSGLSLSNTGDFDGGAINTIGDYVKTGKSLSSLKNKKNGNNNINPKIIKPGSKALQSLQNKIRKSNVSKIQKKPTISDALAKKPQQNNHYNSDSDDDEDEEVVQRSAKKSFSLLIDSKMKKKSK